MIVFYYTDIDNLESIFADTTRSNQRLALKAIHRAYLNDDLQRTFGRYLLPSCIQDIETELNVDPQMSVAPLLKDSRYVSFILDSVNTFDDHRQALESFIVSFFEDQDNIDLWRRNGNGGRGIALGFDTDKLKPDYERFSNVFKDKCSYWSDDIKKDGFKLDHSSKLYTSIKETYKLMTDPRVLDAFKSIFGQETPGSLPQRIKDTLVSNIITTFDLFNKQDVWRNEKEYRIALSPVPLDVSFYKDGEGDYIPYISVLLPVDALRMLTIGPKCGKNSYGMVKSVFMRKGVMHDVRIMNSNVGL